MICTKQKYIIKAYKSILKIASGELPLSVAYSFFKLKQALTPQWEFQIEQERMLFEKYELRQLDGEFTFNSEEDRNEFMQKIEDIGMLHVDIEVDPVHVRLDSDLKMSMEDVENLEGFVVFE